ncbi:MAG: hypothetical protein Q8R91_04430 [Candidatus Omnitrophota bacterium]|nr:hypothetical protein [Candidatus Omnitrophota bacterium]
MKYLRWMPGWVVSGWLALLVALMAAANFSPLLAADRARTNDVNPEGSEGPPLSETAPVFWVEAESSTPAQEEPIAEGVNLKIEPAAQPTWSTAEEFIETLFAGNPILREELVGHRYRALGVRPLYPEPAEGGTETTPSTTSYEAAVYDYDGGRALTVRGDSNVPGEARISIDLDGQLIPNHAEWEEAVQLLEKDAAFGPLLRRNAVIPYQAMPLVWTDQRLGGDRSLCVGLKPRDAAIDHQIVCVNMLNPQIMRQPAIQQFPGGAPPTSRATPTLCGYPDAGQGVDSPTGNGTAQVMITDSEGQTLWQFSVTRPAQSSGLNGSGVELRDVYYRGKKVLAQAHAPILNVKYAHNICGPYRDWLYSEDKFQVPDTGCETLAPGIRRCTSAPSTILDSGSDVGNFNGVVLYPSGSDTILVSEQQAGWYRYLSEWRFSQDGTITPQFGFSAVESSCVCKSHVHHVYWRLDFDVGPARRNVVQVFNGSIWRTVTREEKHYRDAQHRQWTVLDPIAQRRYLITPGPYDGSAVSDAYAQGDVWILRYRPDEIDDGRPAFYGPTAANLDKFVNGELVAPANVVLWYAAHFAHGPDTHAHNSVVGPTLRPADQSW